MAKTVGLPTGIATRLVLEGKIQRKGILSPLYPDLYNPLLTELEKHGVKMIEESTRASFPKL